MHGSSVGVVAVMMRPPMLDVAQHQLDSLAIGLQLVAKALQDASDILGLLPPFLGPVVVRSAGLFEVFGAEGVTLEKCTAGVRFLT
jgi:hypothetical protein